jgi:hypothetical protein
MEAPIEIFISLPLLSAYFVALKCLIFYGRKVSKLAYNFWLSQIETSEIHCRCIMTHLLRRFFHLRYRKIPVKESSYTSDEEGSYCLVFS